MCDARVILLVCNELCPSLIQRFMATGQLPTFERLHNRSLLYTTRGGAKELEDLPGIDEAILLDQLPFEFFRDHWIHMRPTLSTLFLHGPAREQGQDQSATLAAYRRADGILGQVLQLADEHTSVVLSTALGQRAPVCYEPLGVRRLLAFAGVKDYRQVAPMMTHEFAIEFASEQAARCGEEQLRAMCVDGRPALRVTRTGLRIAVACAITSVLDPSAQVECEGDHHWSRENFFTIFRAADLDGLLWIKRPGGEHRMCEQPLALDLDRVIPTILAELEQPAMRASA